MKTFLAAALLLTTTLFAAPQRFAQRLAELEDDDGATTFAVPANVKVIRNVAYGPAVAQRFDVYVPQHATAAPVIFMIHGGGWRLGDKGGRAVVENKLTHWSAQGYIFISANYRMVPEAPPLTQADDITRAFKYAQQHAAEWGADPARFILMGHSAGAHLAALVTSTGAVKPRATVLLDSGALDVPRIMRERHLPLYDQAFGSDPSTWRAASPWHQLKTATRPILAVCSTRRMDSCSEADAFVAKATSLGSRASVLRENLSHRQINETLGEQSAYTAAVDAFVKKAIE